MDCTGVISEPSNRPRTVTDGFLAGPTQAADRNAQIVERLKEAYQNRCAICGLQLHIGGGKFYSEATHIIPLGAPHHGPDIPENMIPLCPNHHKQFNSGSISIKPDQSVHLRLPDGRIVRADPPTATFYHPADTPVGTNFLRWHYERSMAGPENPPE